MNVPMTRAVLIKKIRALATRAPITEAFERKLREPLGGLNDHPTYRTQKEHWLGWLAEYGGPGYYGRKTWDKHAEQIYNRVVNPAMVLWLGEAAGIDQSILKQAVSAALPRAPILSSMAGAIRKIIPWSVIEERL